MAKTVRPPDLLLLIATCALLAVGVVMVYSSSAVIAQETFGDGLFYVKRQLLFAGIGLFLMFVVMKVDYWRWQRWSQLLLIICFVLLLLVLIPGVGLQRGGARSWLGIGAFSIQPSEFMKLAMILFISRLLSDYGERIIHFRKGVLPLLLLSGSAFALIMMQPDLGTGTVMMGTVLVLIYIAGARLAHLFGLALLGIVGFVALVLAAPYRIARILAFLDPWQDPLGSGYHLIQSLYAIGPGGFTGLGLGMSRQKFSYLPEPYNDFIFSILAEELGFIGVATVLGLFMIVLWRGISIAFAAPDRFGSFLAAGIVGLIAIQVVINLGVVSGMFPVTGITLPLISYGGSSLTLILLSLGVLLNISRFSRL